VGVSVGVLVTVGTGVHVGGTVAVRVAVGTVAVPVGVWLRV
jgi:hypothetical protein